jgi:hypothetical protein
MSRNRRGATLLVDWVTVADAGAMAAQVFTVSLSWVRSKRNGGRLGHATRPGSITRRDCCGYMT